MAFLRFVLMFVLAIIVYRLIFKFLIPYLIGGLFGFGSKNYQSNSYRKQDQRKEGDVTIEDAGKSNQKSKSRKAEGEYVDYEEVK